MFKILNLFLILMSLVVFKNACADDMLSYEKLQQENDKLKQQIEEKNEKIKQLEDELKKYIVDSEEDYKNIIEVLKTNEYAESIRLIDKYLSEHPKSDYKKQLVEAKDAVNKKIEEKKRLKEQGFEKIKQVSILRIDDKTSIKIDKVFKKSRMNLFDRSGDEYYFRDADKNNVYITFDFSISSKNDDPKLPSLYVGKINGELIQDIKKFEVEFYSWSDYGSYLGNYHDSKNDFAKKDTVKFVAGCQVPKDKSKYIVFTDKKDMYTRNDDSYGSPPVKYVSYGNDLEHQSIHIDEFMDKYTAFKVIK